MGTEISLSAAVRENLLSLGRTEELIARTQNRLSTGLKVASPVDDARIFFESKAISDQAGDLSDKKDGIDQAISSVTTALEAIEAVDSLVQQIKGLLIGARSASAAERVVLQNQYNELLTQIDNVTLDATYQGLNLVAGTGVTLSVEFSTNTASVMDIDSVDVTTGTLGLDITSITGFSVASTATTKIDDALAEVNLAIGTLRGYAKSLGSNIAVLKTRLDFTDSFVDILETGAAKLVLADVTEEGANLVALQTRQQLGISALAFAGQSEQSVLQLFR